ncbi:SpaA isopeptide-forming pilin-related protein [Lactiplantibacillus plantarum]|uniref:SpaA isopeptide-forming pilin-related protein n=1 Tax=Lactiplantibacillus plantarum TaxID=1590 RepID=UPI0021A35792
MKQVTKVMHIFSVILLLLGMLVSIIKTENICVQAAEIPIVPTYQNTTTGTYPINAWKVVGQQDVINHRGGDQVSGWDNDTGWDGNSTDTTKSYLKFGNAKNPDYQIRKFARETGTPGLFDVYLNVKGNSVKVNTDIVFVNDWSGSMNDPLPGASGLSKLHQQKNAMDKILDNLKDNDSLKIGFVGYSSNHTKEDIGGVRDKGQGRYKGNNAIINLKPVSAATSLIRDAYTSLGNQVIQGGATFTQKALMDAQKLLDADSAKQKIIVLMTDGVPSVSYHVTKAKKETRGASDYLTQGNIATEFDYSKIEMPMINYGNTGMWYNATKNNSFDYSSISIYKVNGLEINSPWNGLIGTAEKIKNRGIQIYAMGMNITTSGTSGRQDSGGTQQVNVGDLQSALSDVASENNKYFRVDNNEQLDDFTTNITRELSSISIKKGSIKDPIGSQFSYEPNSLSVKSVGKKSVPDDDLSSFVYSKDDKTVSVNNLYLGQDQEVQIHYQERIKTEDAGFKPDFWYQMNGETLLTPKAGSAAVDFGIPSGKAPATTVYVQKQWHQLSNQSLPDTLNVTVQRKVADGSLDSNWQQTLVLKKADNWKASFTAPAYNNQGQSFSYVVKSEDASGIDLSSFISSQNMDQQTATLTLTNQQYGFQFQKKTTDGTDLSADQLKAMQFNLTQYSDNSFQQVSKTNAITSTDLQVLAPGYYGIQEVAAPTGYQLDGTTYLFQLTSDGQWQYHGTKDNVTSGSIINGQQALNPVGDKSDDFTVTGDHQQILTLTKYDEPKPSVTLRVIKQDNRSQYLAGATFTLQPSAGEAETITSSAISEGQAFATKLVADGTYTMSEKKAPDGYQSNPAKIAIQVATTGKQATVTIDGEALKPGESKNGYTLAVAGSTITLQAINQPLAILPHTGGQGYQRLLGIALGLISAAFLLLLVVLIKRRVVKQHD